MKKARSLAIAAVVSATALLVTSTAVFADQSGTAPANTYPKQFTRNLTKIDPIQMMEKQKTEIQKRVTEGKITQDQANKMITQIDQKIKAIQDFNALTTQQKKDKLLNDFTASINKRVQDGKLTQDKVNQMIADYKAKLDKWDGTGYPFFGRGMEGMPGPGMDFRGKMGPGQGPRGKMSPQQGTAAKADPLQMLQQRKADIQNRLTEGKITKDQADKMTAQIDQKIKEIQDFNALTTQQKKDKLLNDFTTSINNRVKEGKLTQDKANQMIADSKAKLDKWDGTGFPFMGRGMKGMPDRGRDFKGGPGNSPKGFRGHSGQQTQGTAQQPTT